MERTSYVVIAKGCDFVYAYCVRQSTVSTSEKDKICHILKYCTDPCDGSGKIDGGVQHGSFPKCYSFCCSCRRHWHWQHKVCSN